MSLQSDEQTVKWLYSGTEHTQCMANLSIMMFDPLFWKTWLRKIRKCDTKTKRTMIFYSDIIYKDAAANHLRAIKTYLPPFWGDLELSVLHSGWILIWKCSRKQSVVSSWQTRLICIHRGELLCFCLSPQEPVIQPAREDASVLHPQGLAGSSPPLQRHGQTNQTRLREGSTLPRRHEPVPVAHPAGSPVSPAAGVLRLGLVWKLSK